MTTDKTLCRIVFTEERAGFRIEGFLTRYGGLEVFVFAPRPAGKGGWIDPVYQGDNILQARAWIDFQALSPAARRAA